LTHLRARKTDKTFQSSLFSFFNLHKKKMVSLTECFGVVFSKYFSFSLSLSSFLKIFKKNFFIRFRRRAPKAIEPDSVIGGLLQSYPANPIQHPELNPELSDIAANLEQIIAFVNPKSGGQKGRIVLERLKNYLHKDNVFDLTKGGPRPG
jgi:hypothetical protein